MAEAPQFSWQDLQQAPDFPRDPIAVEAVKKKYLTEFGPQLLDTAAAESGIHPELLKSVKHVESGAGWDPNIQSKKGALGPMQMTQPAAIDMGVTDLTDPEQNIMGGARYLRKMIDAFGGDVGKGLAAYNAGERRVRTAIQAGGENWTDHIPQETRQYLKRVAQAHQAGMPIETAAPVSEYPLPLQPKITGVPAEGPLPLQIRIGKEEPPPSSAPFSLEELTSSADYQALPFQARETARLKYLRDYPAPPPPAGAPITRIGGIGGGWEENQQAPESQPPPAVTEPSPPQALPPAKTRAIAEMRTAPPETWGDTLYHAIWGEEYDQLSPEQRRDAAELFGRTPTAQQLIGLGVIPLLAANPLGTAIGLAKFALAQATLKRGGGYWGEKLAGEKGRIRGENIGETAAYLAPAIGKGLMPGPRGAVEPEITPRQLGTAPPAEPQAPVTAPPAIEPPARPTQAIPPSPETQAVSRQGTQQLVARPVEPVTVPPPILQPTSPAEVISPARGTQPLRVQPEQAIPSPGLAETPATPPVETPVPAQIAPADIHTLAEQKHIPWDNDPAFAKFSETLTGESHLDRMTPEQLGTMKTALEQGERPVTTQPTPEGKRIVTTPSAEEPVSTPPEIPAEAPALPSEAQGAVTPLQHQLVGPTSWPTLPSEAQGAVTPLSQPPIQGSASTVRTERGTAITTHFTVVDATDLIASHDTTLRVNPEYPAEMQPRDRTRVASDEQINRIAQNLQPEWLADSPKAGEGAPIIGPDLVVESGNGRVIALQRAYAQRMPTAGQYKQWLEEHAGDFGLTAEQIQQVRTPVLARVRETPVDRAQFTQEANEQTTAAMSAVEQAKQDVTKLTSGIMAQFAPSDTGLINTATNRGFIREFLRTVVAPTERGRYLTSEGLLSQEGVLRVRNAIFAKAYGESDALSRLAEDPDDNIRNLTNAMLVAAPRLAILKNAIAQGSRYPLDLTPEIAAAANKLSQLRSQGQTIPDYLNQRQLFGEELSPLAKDLLRVFDHYRTSGKKMLGVLQRYADAVDAAGDPQQSSVFGTAVPTLPSVLQAAIDIEESDVQTNLFPSQPAGGREAQVSPPPSIAKEQGAPYNAPTITAEQRARQAAEEAGTATPSVVKEEPAGYNAPLAAPSAIAPTFYSSLRRTFETSKQEKFAPPQAIALLKSPGVKADEVKWSGVEDWLKQQTRSVNKQEILDFLDANNVQVEEVVKGEERPPLTWSHRTDSFGNDVWQPDQDAGYNFIITKVPNKPYEFTGPDNRLVRADSLEEAQQQVENERRRVGLSQTPTKFSEWQIPGAQEGTYRELLLTMPAEQKKPAFTSVHFDEPNVLAHVRFNDRTDAEGNRVLFLEEIQSDWATEGRKKGYRLTEAEKQQRIAELSDKYKEAEQNGNDLEATAILTAIEDVRTGKGLESAVPPFPFAKNWQEVVLKRMLRYASENGYDKLAWTTGAMQQERYDLSKQVERITWNKNPARPEPGKIYVAVHVKEKTEPLLAKQLTPEEIEQNVGKEIAKKITEGGSYGTLKGLDLKVGGEWAVNLYDRMIPQFLNKYGKKWGATVGTTQIATSPLGRSPYAKPGEKENIAGARFTPVSSFPITPAMRQSVTQEGQALFERKVPYVEPRTRTEAIAQGRDVIRDLKQPITDIPTAGGGLPRAGTGVRTIAVSIADQLAKRGWIDLRGQRVNTAEDLAVLARVFRDKRLETFRIFYVQSGKIVAHEGFTSRSPGTVQVFPEGKAAQEAYNIRRRIRRLTEVGGDLKAGPVDYYILHNHPGGNPTPSPQDVALSRYFATRVPGFKGHVVIDFDTYTVIADNYKTGSMEQHYRDVPESVLESTDPLKSQVPSDIFDKRINSQDDVAAIGKSLSTPEQFVTLLYRDSWGGVRAIQEMPIALFRKPKEASDYLRGRTRIFGAPQVLGYYGGQENLGEAAGDMVRNGTLLDFVTARGPSLQQRGEVAEPGMSFGRSAAPRRYRVAEEKKSYEAPLTVPPPISAAPVVPPPVLETHP